MPERAAPLALRNVVWSRRGGVAVAVLAVALTTVCIYPLRAVVEPSSTGIVYLLAVLLVSTYWGAGLGLLTAVLSAVAFNYFHIPPTGRLAINRGEDLVALVVFLAAAIIASSVAELARARARDAELRRREADLAATMARVLLGGTSVGASLAVVDESLAAALGVRFAHVELAEGPGGLAGGSGLTGAELELPLRDGERLLGALKLPPDLDAGTRQRLDDGVVPALVALLGAALDREALQAEVVETRALRRSDEIKTAVLRAVSHDLRSPLTSIITAGEALRSRGVDSAERAELADSVVEEAARLSTLVDKLLEMSQLQAGAAAPRTDWCSIDEVIRGAAERAAGAADFTLSLDGDLPLIKADAAQLERALENLLENAARYANGHAVSVRARTVGTWLVIRVVDRGPGIPTSELEHVFEAFYRGRDVGSRHAGAGLGLAIVRGFIEANGGRVWAESTPGQGTTFVVQLPLADSAAASATTQPATRQSA